MTLMITILGLLVLCYIYVFIFYKKSSKEEIAEAIKEDEIKREINDKEVKRIFENKKELKLNSDILPEYLFRILKVILFLFLLSSLIILSPSSSFFATLTFLWPIAVIGSILSFLVSLFKEYGSCDVFGSFIFLIICIIVGVITAVLIFSCVWYGTSIFSFDKFIENIFTIVSGYFSY